MLRGRNMKEKENSRNKCNKEWKCSVCNLIFRKQSLLNLHTAVHSSIDIKIENQTSACPQCGLEFQKQSELVNHVSQHGRSALPKTKRLTPLSTYKCSMCYKRFATKIRLQQHCLAHGAEDQKPLPCSICLKRFMNNSALSGHLKTHKGKAATQVKYSEVKKVLIAIFLQFQFLQKTSRSLNAQCASSYFAKVQC